MNIGLGLQIGKIRKGGPPIPSGFNPSDYGTVALWLSDTGTDPAIWLDLSGNGNDAAQHFDALGGAFTFTVPLYPADAATDHAPSHYWASAQVSPANVPILQAMQAEFPGSTLNEYDLATQPDYPQDRLFTLNLRTAKYEYLPER